MEIGKIMKMKSQDFEEMLEIMKGMKVKIRMIDKKMNELMKNKDEEVEEVER